MRALRLLIVAALLCTMLPAHAQEAMDELTLRQHMLQVTGKPPAQYRKVVSTVSTRHGSSGRSEFHRGLDYRIIYGSGILRRESGRFEGKNWDRDANGITTIHQASFAQAKGDIEKVEISRVTQPMDAWRFSQLNSRGFGTIEYVNPTTYLVMREDTLTPVGNIQTEYSDYRTVQGYTTFYHWVTDNAGDKDHSESHIVSFEVGHVEDPDLAIPPTKNLVLFPLGQTSVEIPATFYSSQTTFVSSSGHTTGGQNSGPSHIFIRAAIGAREIDLLLDSGAAGIVLDSRVVHDLGITTIGAGSVVDARRVDVSHAVIPEIRVGDLSMQNVVVQTQSFAFDEGSAHVVGLLGYEFLAGVGLTIDYAHRRIIANPAGAFVPPTMTAESDILPLRTGFHWPMVTAMVNGAVADRVIVDTGAGSDFMLFDYFLRRYPEATNPRVAMRLENRQYRGAGGAFESQGLRLADVDIGRYHFRQFDAVAVTSSQSYPWNVDGVIGPGILRHFTVGFDYAGGKLYMVHNAGQ
ncbi:MAG: aspartyl protease family protein [Candidatus Eremiobacteraeota bacterium]|nr:aspartyl protease family protein [Candidatus Eremiobacteraeota bacterium]